MMLRGILESEGRPPPNPLKTLVIVPLFHVTGEVPVMLNSFVISRGMVLMPKWDAGEALRLIEKEKITYFVGVPTMSLELMNHPDRGNYDLSTLTDIAAGGAPRPVAHVERLRTVLSRRPTRAGLWADRNQRGRMRQFLGQLCRQAGLDRACASAVRRAGDPRRGRPPSAGPANAARSPSAPPPTSNAIGKIREATAAAFTADGYLRTGDIGYLDEDGYLFIVDRKKDIIIRGGENISAAEVEAALYGCEGIAEAAVFGVPDERLGEVPVAILHRREGSSISEEELRDFLDGRLAAFKIPGADDLFRRAAAPARHRQDRPGRAQAAIRRLTHEAAGGHPPHPADRRRRGRRTDRCLSRLAAARRKPASPRPARSGVRAVSCASPRTGA